MPVHDPDDSNPSPPAPEENAPAAGAGDASSAPPPAAGASPAERRRWRRVVNRRNAIWTAVVAVVAALALVFIFLILYRSGQVDNIIASQIVRTLAEYNIRTEIGSFKTELGARTAELRDLKLYDATTGAQLGHVERVLATVRIEDLWALKLSRNVNLESLEVDGLEAWVAFDDEGRSNFRNIRLPPPSQNQRIVFSYATARIKLNGAVLHFDDQRHDISGEARNLRATIEPDDPNAPAESRMNRVTLALSDSKFVYDGRPVEGISIDARGRINQIRAEIQEVVLRSPLAEARLEGTMDDWRNLRYQLKVTQASVDLTQASNILKTDTALRGAGRFVGTVSGEGTRYHLDGEIQSDALAADNIRLKALKVTLRGGGEGANYEAQGRAVAELLTAGDFQLSGVQLAGGVMGTGTDFRWVGELRSAAVRGAGATIAGLILSDAVAELREGDLSGGAKSIAAGNVTYRSASGTTTVKGAQASGVSFTRDESGATRATAASARAGQLTTAGATVGGVEASGVRADIAPNGASIVDVERVRVAGLTAAGARTGSLNIAGVRLSIHDGRVEGRSGDIGVGTVAFKSGATDGRVDDVRLARPVFVLEPGGRYRASADLSLGGGVLGSMKLGAARSTVVASNDAVQLNNFTADIFGGRAAGNATVSMNARGASRVAATFDGVDVGGLLALTGNVVPVTGAATGSVDLRFPGANFKAASGTLDARFSGDTGNEAQGRTPLSGEVALRADRGLFQVERANLRTAASELNATGQFSFAGNSNLQINLTSSDASELHRVVVASGLAPELEEGLDRFKIALGGQFEFKGTLTGDLDNPLVNGRASLASLNVGGRDLGTLSADIATDAAEVRITDGRLTKRDGGGALFTATIPRFGTNNITVDAALDRFDAGNLLAALTSSSSDADKSGGFNASALAGVGPASGNIHIEGLPNAMKGRAELRAGPGVIGGQPLDELVARASFNGSEVNIEKLDARLRAGSITANGSYNLDTKVFDLRASGTDVQLAALLAVAGTSAARVPPISGAANFTASARGDVDDPRSYRIEINAEGRDVTINGQPAGTLTLTGTTTAEQKFNLELTTGLLGQPQIFRAEVDLTKDELPATIRTTFSSTDLTRLFAVLLPESNVRVTGRATGEVNVATTILGDEGLLSDVGLGALQGSAQFSELVLQVEDVQLAAEDPLVVKFSPNEIIFEKTRFTGPGTNILFGGVTALREGGRQNLSVDGDLNLRVLNNLSPNMLLAGTARVSVRVAGTFADPRLTGTAEAARVSVSMFVADERLTVTDINGRVRFTANQAQIDTLTGRLGGGQVAVTGGALLEGLRPSRFSLSVRADDITVPFPDEFRSTADASLEIRGALDRESFVSGLVSLRRAEYTEDIDLADFINRRREIDITEGGGGTLLSAVQLDLQVEGRDALVVRNNLADAVGSVSLRIRGSADDPIVSGRITATRGTLNFRNDRYELTRAFVDLPPRREADPILNIQAESEIRGYRVIVGLTGPLSQPLTTLRSDPALPQADVVSLITTGNLSSGDQSASTLAQSGLGTATSLLTDRLINAPVQRATDKLFGLNRFEIDPLISGRGGASPTARLTVGRQINRNLSITYSTNVTTDQNQVVAVEYRVSDRLSFVAQYQQGAATNALRTQQSNFNFEIRFRKRF